jgi:hypothetical protein
LPEIFPGHGQAGTTGTAGVLSSGNATTTVIEDKLAGDVGSYAATGSANNGWTMQMVALKP